MKTRPLIQTTVYRASSLLYFRTIFGGKGARLGSGGRFNRPGTPTIYVSFEPETAFLEYQQGVMPPRPCATVAAELLLKEVLDLTGDLAGQQPDIQDWACDWEAAATSFAINPKTPTSDCASWRCSDIVRTSQLSGILYPSLRNPGRENLAIFPEEATAGNYYLQPHDPVGEIAAAAKGGI